MLAFLLPLILINYIKNLKLLVPLSSCANVLTIISFGIILYYLIREDITFEGKEPVGEWKNFPLFFGTVLFALEAIGVVSRKFSVSDILLLSRGCFRSCLWKMKWKVHSLLEEPVGFLILAWFQLLSCTYSWGSLDIWHMALT